MSLYSLRKFQAGDGLSLYQALHDKRVVKHMASDGLSLETCKKIVAEAISHWEDHAIGSYAVVDKKTDKIIGWAGFKLWQENEFEILIVLSPRYYGLGGEIFDELIVKAKQEFQLKKIYILLPETRKGFRWIERKGFKFCKNETFNNEPFKKFVKII